MTFIAVASFFDMVNRWPGYVLGIDSGVGLASNLDPESEGGKAEQVIEGGKYFSGRRYVGLFSGAAMLPSIGTEEENWRATMKELSSTFDELKPNQEFDDVPLMRHGARNVSLIIAQRFPSRVELYNVRQTDPRSSTLTAKLVHCANQSTWDREKSKIWFGPIDEELRKFPQKERLTHREAQIKIYGIGKNKRVTKILGYTPKDFRMLFISPEEHGRIINGTLVPIT